MLKLLKIAVTGGMAAGKSTVCQFLLEKGACVVSADEIVQSNLSPDSDLGCQVKNLLGKDIEREGKLDRQLIADKVFNQPKKLDALEKLLHPAVFHTIEELYRQAQKAEKFTCFVAEVPLLYETGAEAFFDITVAVVAKDELCKKRFKDLKTFEQRKKRQLPAEIKAAKADFVIENNSSLKDLKQSINILYRRLGLHEPRKDNSPTTCDQTHP